MKTIAIPLIWLTIAGSSFAATIDAQTTDALLIGGGARPLGMGRAFTAVVEDADAIFINPAGLAGLMAPEAMSMFTNLLGDIYYSEFSGIIPSRFGTFGLGYVTTGVNQVLIPIDPPVVTDYYDNLLIATYSAPLALFFDYGRGIYFGLNAKIFNRGWVGLSDQSATGYSADFGLKYVVSPYLSFGFNRQNLLPVDLGGVIKYRSGAEETVAGINKLGIAIRPKPWRNALLLAGDLDIPAQSGRAVTGHLGAEWQINNFFIARTGLDQSLDASSPTLTSWNPTFGVSVLLSGFRVDYAFHPYYNNPDLATTYLSISFRGEKWSALTGETM
ncbi:MAG: hypothetical protein WCV63_10635 [Negativicutes bacterium]|jgi:hypothetical protein